jgi:hypothetical protein
LPFLFYLALTACLVVAFLNYEKGRYWAAVAGMGAPLVPVVVHWLAVEISWLHTPGSWAPTLIADVVGLGLAALLLAGATLTALFGQPRPPGNESEQVSDEDLLLT